MLKGEEAPIYFADYEAPHEYILKYASGFKGIRKYKA
jgi:hypothetical protein